MKCYRHILRIQWYDRIHNSEIVAVPCCHHSIIRKCKSLFGHCLGRTPQHIKLFSARLTSLLDVFLIAPGSSHLPKKLVAGSDSLWWQFPTGRSMKMCYPSRSFWVDSAVPADHVIMTFLRESGSIGSNSLFFHFSETEPLGINGTCGFCGQMLIRSSNQ